MGAPWLTVSLQGVVQEVQDLWSKSVGTTELPILASFWNAELTSCEIMSQIDNKCDLLDILMHVCL